MPAQPSWASRAHPGAARCVRPPPRPPSPSPRPTASARCRWICPTQRRIHPARRRIRPARGSSAHGPALRGSRRWLPRGMDRCTLLLPPCPSRCAHLQHASRGHAAAVGVRRHVERERGGCSATGRREGTRGGRVRVFFHYILLLSKWAHMGLVGLGLLIEADIYKRSASNIRAINRGGRLDVDHLS
jgi:hypothetical protein